MPAPFLNRETELADLSALLETERAQFLLVYGRRRVGKTRLLLEWSEQAQAKGWQSFYWQASRGTAGGVMQDFAERLWKWRRSASHDAEERVDMAAPPQYRSWRTLLEELVDAIGDTPTIVILDEFPYAVDADASLPSHLQWAWDHLLQDRRVVLVLAGSHVSTMIEQRENDRPLYGRFTGQIALQPMSYGVVANYFSEWTPVERVSVFAITGGVPAYFTRFDAPTLTDNIERHLYRPTGLFRSEPSTLISDLVREAGNYEEVLRAIARKNHAHSDIAKAANMSVSQLSHYLKHLRKLWYVKRITPATLPPEQRRSTNRARYELRDPFLRFYYRFIEPYPEHIERGKVALLWERIADQFRAFVGTYTFEELAREWVWEQAVSPAAPSDGAVIPFLPEVVGEHWSPTEQIDVVAVNWREKQIVLGECKWGADKVGRAIIRERIRTMARVVPDTDFDVHYVFFARSGFTPAAQREAEKVDAMLVDLDQLDADLA